MRLGGIGRRRCIRNFNSDDGLEDKNAGSCYSSVVGAVVGMFPEDAVVDFVAADYVWKLEWVSRAGVMPTVEISYVPSSRNLASGYWYTPAIVS